MIRVALSTRTACNRPTAVHVASRAFGTASLSLAPWSNRLQLQQSALPLKPILQHRSLVHVSKYGNVGIPSTVDVYSTVFSKERRESSAIAVVDSVTGVSTTYRELNNRIEALSDALYNRLGFQKWDVIAVLSGNHVQSPVVAFGAMRAGATLSPINPTYTVDEVSFQLQDSKAKFLFVHPKFLEVAKAAATKAGIPLSKIMLLNEPGLDFFVEFKTVDALVANPGPKRVSTSFTAKEIAEHPAYLCYSSGTTGLPKGVETTQRNVIANVLQYEKSHAATGDDREGDVWAGVLPFFHIYGLTLCLHVAFHRGYTLVVFPKFDLPHFLGSLGKYNVTTAHIVPPIALALANHPIVDKFPLPSLRYTMSGAAPLPSDLVGKIHERLGVLTTQGYGLTETSPVALLKPLRYVLDHPDAAGELYPGMEARVVDPDSGANVPLHAPGELWLRGPNIMKGYHNNASATAESIDAEGWFRTGDVAVVDEHGLFRIVDRLKELIKYKGFQVAPAELEEILLEHDDVADCAVIGVPDETAGEIPRAFVVLKPEATVAENEIAEFVNGQVAPHKKLRGGLKFVESIPKSASGKILRRLLRGQ
ncbi:hypothetical protein BC830DRAFT_1126438 [Chytriomyces sp. MP71]|nr:hypothetical protein BC830DRAFT_1126438 [Chytriomyces sp. MP71]